MVGFKPDLDDQLVLLVVPEMNYNVLSGTLSNQPTCLCVVVCFVFLMCKIFPHNVALLYTYTDYSVFI